MDKYSGSITTTGTSEAIRLDKPFFRSNPEFRQKAKVQAQVLGRGTVLISVVDDVDGAYEQQSDPALTAFLAFLERDITNAPERMVPPSAARIADAVALTDNVEVSDDDEIPDDIDF